jgi:mRNA interferase MazF
MSVQRGEVYRVRPDPAVGHEQQKTRPCVVVSSNLVNENSSLVVVCPLTEGVKLTPTLFHVPISKGEGGTTKDSMALCNQVKAVDKVRLMEKIGNLKAPSMSRIDAGLRALLDLS